MPKIVLLKANNTNLLVCNEKTDLPCTELDKSIWDYG